MQKAQYEYCMLIPEITVMTVKTLFMNLGKPGGSSSATTQPSGSSTVKPTSGAGTLHAESRNINTAC